MIRTTSVQMEAIQVLDKGFVRLENCMGGDGAVVRAARVSYGSEAKTEGEDQKLIAYLLKHNHGTPFEHAVFTFHVKLPIFVARQWIRHRMSSYNEASFRYREPKEEFYYPKEWRAQDTKNKQGSVAAPSDFDHAELNLALDNQCRSTMADYKAMIAQGVSREMARMLLPVNLYTEWYWTVNARALLHFLELRCDSHAQWETRQYAYALAQIMRHTMPWTFDAWLAAIPENKIDGYREMMYEVVPQFLAKVVANER